MKSYCLFSSWYFWWFIKTKLNVTKYDYMQFNRDDKTTICLHVYSDLLSSWEPKCCPRGRCANVMFLEWIIWCCWSHDLQCPLTYVCHSTLVSHQTQEVCHKGKSTLSREHGEYCEFKQMMLCYVICSCTKAIIHPIVFTLNDFSHSLFHILAFY